MPTLSNLKTVYFSVSVSDTRSVSHMVYRGLVLVWRFSAQKHCFVNKLIKYTVLLKCQICPLWQVWHVLNLMFWQEWPVMAGRSCSSNSVLVITCLSKHSLVEPSRARNRCSAWWPVYPWPAWWVVWYLVVGGYGYWYMVGGGTGYWASRPWLQGIKAMASGHQGHGFRASRHQGHGFRASRHQGIKASRPWPQGLSVMASRPQCHGLRCLVSQCQVPCFSVSGALCISVSVSQCARLQCCRSCPWESGQSDKSVKNWSNWCQIVSKQWPVLWGKARA